MMLYAVDIALMLDVEPNKPFAVRRSGADNDLIGYFYFDINRGICNCASKYVSKNVLMKILDGEYIIDKVSKPKEKVEKFNPHVGERYWYIPLPNHTEKSAIFGSVYSFNQSLGPNCFRTREDARRGKKELIEKYEAFRKECNKYAENKKKMEEFFND